MNVNTAPNRQPEQPLPNRLNDDRPRSLRQLALQRRLDALFRALASDFLLREQFITDPAQIASEYINGKRMAPEEAATLNYLIYACLANNYLISWFRNYSLSNDGRAITQKLFLNDFSTAVVQNHAPHVVSALSHFALSGKARIRLDDDWLQAIFGRWHNFDEDLTRGATDNTGTDSTGTDSTGTDSTGTDSTGTDSTGTDSTGTDSTGTDNTGTDSTGTDSTGTDSTGTDSTGTDATGTDATGTDATGTDATGTDATGTEPNGTLTAVTWKTFITDTTEKTHPSTTPFTHTGMTRSPITTETTQNTQRFLGTSHVVVTLEALTTYARQLIRAGALESVWIE